MKTTIDVTNKREAELIRQALADPEARVLVNVMGALLSLPNVRARLRVMTFVSDRLAHEDDTDKPPAAVTPFPVPGKPANGGAPLFPEGKH